MSDAKKCEEKKEEEEEKHCRQPIPLCSVFFSLFSSQINFLSFAQNGT